MALVLVVVNDFASYKRGMIITDQQTIDGIRLSDYFTQTVLVSDTIIPPPVVDPDLTPAQLLAAYRELIANLATQQSALTAATALNGEQNVTLQAQRIQIDALVNAVNVLAAKLDNPNSGPPVDPDIADDLPLAEADGDLLSTNAGAVLAGDAR